MRNALITLAVAVLFGQSNAFAEDGSKTASAVFAGGCFWCMEADFEKLDGVGDVVSGYAGGVKQNPTYRNHEGHLEVVRVPYDPQVVSYRELVDYFFRHIDPFDDGGQFCDRGHSYTTAVFYANADEYGAAKAAKEAAEKELGKPVVTPLVELNQFWKAEGYHQDYYKKNKIRYGFYRHSCGRDHRVKEVWGGH
ncbi:peptide-methionine (S)-S-oxide reductase MsrA [Hyphococcus luteus]|uniref:Peptide methionine sulfoxide reductase MsrA n=1 Tax=Hyphococcus luteus TaxID=2058213 RepID=A0A2S7JZR3_9PROT|nr:peptide-methionine (S)-S-oxide reductase MsrA [Marinicaulis flavus]PQA85742.1 peptide-methionine (S)-S-oxide reductase [Marinicaulis flavus]